MSRCSTSRQGTGSVMGSLPCGSQRYPAGPDRGTHRPDQREGQPRTWPPRAGSVRHRHRRRNRFMFETAVRQERTWTLRQHGPLSAPENRRLRMLLKIPTGAPGRPSAEEQDSSRENKEWWSQTESNRRPLACHASALPTELWPHIRGPGWAGWPSRFGSALLIARPAPDQAGKRKEIRWRKS